MEYEIIDNKSKIFYNGSKWPSNNYGEFIITNRIMLKNRSNKIPYYMCTFDGENHIPVVSSHIRRGNVKNRYCKEVLGVGFYGFGKYNKKHRREYNLWHRMMRRCYSKEEVILNSTYKNVTVDAKWHNFQNFCEDIQELDGYVDWVNPNNKMQLDKDILCNKLGIKDKIYSKYTCKFASSKENNKRENKEQTIDGRIIIGIRLKDMYLEEFTNQTEFADRIGISRTAISACLHKNIKHCNGWAFKYKGDMVVVSRSKIIIGTRICDNYKEEFYNRSEFCKKYEISPHHIGSCLSKKREHHMGWSFHYKLNDEIEHVYNELVL